MLIAIREYLGTCLGYLVGILLIALISLDITQAVLRYTLDTTLLWGHEISSLLLQGVAWTAAGLLWLKRQHMIVDFFSGRFKRFTDFLTLPSEIIMLIGVVWLVPETIAMWDAYSNLVMGTLPIAGSIRLVPMIFGMALLAIAAILNIANSFSVKQSSKGLLQNNEVD